MIPNGDIQFSSQLPSSNSEKKYQNSKNTSEVIALNNKNWLIHYHYCRREFEICNILVKEELKKNNGVNEFANYVRGIILRHEGKLQESLEYFQKSHLLNPRGVDNIRQVARSLFLLGRQKLSLHAFMEAKNMAHTPEWDTYYNLGLCFLKLEDITKAKEYLHQAVQLSRQEKCFKALANTLIFENDIQGAIDIYNKALQITPDNVDFMTSLGLLYMKIGENQKAFEKFGSALANDSSYPRALLSIGSIMQNYKEYDVALTKYKTASIHFMESPALWNNIGMCFFGKKKFIFAVSCLKRANFLAPFEWKILYNLGLIHLILQQYASAFHFLSSAISLEDKHGIIYLTLAVTLVHLKDFKNAQYAFDRAKIISSNDPIVFLNYSLFLFKQGDITQAVEEFKQFQELSQRACNLDYDVLEMASNLRKNLKISTSCPEKEFKQDQKMGEKRKCETHENQNILQKSEKIPSDAKGKLNERASDKPAMISIIGDK